MSRFLWFTVYNNKVYCCYYFCPSSNQLENVAIALQLEVRPTRDRSFRALITSYIYSSQCANYLLVVVVVVGLR